MKFQPFIPGLPSQDMFRLILEYAIGPDEIHLLFRWGRRLCKRSISLIEHPNFIQFRSTLSSLQSVTHIFVQTRTDLEQMVEQRDCLRTLKIKVSVREDLLHPLIQALQAGNGVPGASCVRVTELEILAGDSDTDQMTPEEANALVEEHTIFVKEASQHTIESSVLMQIEAVTLGHNCSDSVYTLFGELWLKKKRTLRIKHLKISFGSHVSNHAEFQTFMTSLN